MKQYLLVCALLALFNSFDCFSIMQNNHDAKNTNWNDLKVTWGLNVFSSDYFVRLPRTEEEALKGGWTKEKDCSQVNGIRYILGNDRSLLLIFNTKGIIAGMATVIPKGLPLNFPSQAQAGLMYDEGDFYTLNAYFIDPNTVCAKDLSEKQSTGDRLVIKGSKMELDIPLLESQMTKFWTHGQCFWTMGVHYWADFTGQLGENTTPDNFVPLFLQYNSGKLNGFGWALNANLVSKRYEHPTPDVLPRFFKSVPKFLYDPAQSKGVSTMHIYFDSTPQFNFC